MVVLGHDIEHRDIYSAQVNPMAINPHRLLYEGIVPVTALDECFISLTGDCGRLDYSSKPAPATYQDFLAHHLLDKFPVR
jgi:hypothetical protein